MIKKLSLFICAVVFCHSIVYARLYVNEFMACNASYRFDPGYNYNGWLEIYNSGPADINLKGYRFSDDPETPLRYTFSTDRIVSAGAYEIIWCNSEITDAEGYAFKANGNGGTLIISDPDGQKIEEIAYPAQLSNVSYGRTTDGGDEWNYFPTPSFKSSNNDTQVSDKRTGSPVFNVPSGFYDTPLQIALTSETPGAVIHYTTDGKEPDRESSVYDGTPIPVDRNTAIRAIATADGMIDSRITTETYLIGERRPNLPVVLLTTDPDNLWNDEYGIYCVGTNGIGGAGGTGVANYNQDWSRPAEFVYLEIPGDNTSCIHQTIDIEISGNATRKFPLKSLKLKANKKHENNRLNHQFFPEKNSRRFKSLVLRNGGNDFQHYQFRDAFQHLVIANKINLDYQAYRASALYLNGEYYGIMNLRERSNKDWVESNRGIDEEDSYFIEYNYKLTGNTPAALSDFNDLLGFVRNNDMTDQNNYKKIQERIDIGNFINYTAVEMYINNTDWISNNLKAYRAIDRGKWRFILQDLDYGYETDRKNENLLEKLAASDLPVAVLFNNLVKNPGFRKQFIDQYSIITSTLFRTGRVNVLIDSLATVLKPEYPYHSQKWPGNETFYEYIDQRINNLKKYGDVRSEIVYRQLADFFGLGEPQPLKLESSVPQARIMLNGLPLPVLPYDGKYFTDSIIRVEAPQYAGDCTFSHWDIYRNGMILDCFIAERAFTHTIDGDYAFKAIYKQRDTQKRTGLYINEVSASNDIFVDNLFKKEDWIEIYNSSSLPVDLAGYYFSNDKNDLQACEIPTGHPETTVVAANGYTVVWASKKPERGPLHLNFKLDKEGKSIFLSKKDADGTVRITDSLTYSFHDDFQTFGRYPDGEENFYVLTNPTIGCENLLSEYDTFAYTQPFETVQASGLSDVHLSEIVFYPNPVSEILFITGTPDRVDLYDSMGRCVLSDNDPGTNPRINVGNLTSGSYILRIIKNESTFSRIILKK